MKYEHVNLFQDVEKTTNEERDAEEKEKNDKWERQITMYLDKDKGGSEEQTVLCVY